MKRTRNLTGLSAGTGLLLLIFDSRLVMEAARTGLELCMKTVIPALFPFIVLSTVLIRSMDGTGSRLLTFGTSLLGIPESAGSVLIPAFLGGYPVGAKCVHDLYRTGRLGKDQAERMLAFCSNAGPSFLFGMAAACFPEKKTAWVLWGIQIAGAVAAAFLMPVAAESRQTGDAPETERKDDILFSALKAMGIICGWVVLFRVLTAFLQSWFLWCLPQWLQIFLTGLLELTNGCCELMLIDSEKLRFLLCSCMLSFGGLCVLLQTVSVTGELSVKYYILGKLLQTGVSFLLSCAVILRQGWLLPGILTVILAVIRKIQKRSGILKPVPV